MSKPNDPKRLRILYIAGFGRSGSSIIGNILGQTDGFFHGGELRNIWDDGFLFNRVCGCGADFDQCPFWREAGTRLVSERGHQPERIRDERDKYGRTRQLWAWSLPGIRSIYRDRSHRLVGWLEEAYRSIAETAGASVIVDSTMSPVYGHLLTLAPGLDVRVIHLVRDPRAVAHSWAKASLQESRKQVAMRRYGPVTSSLRWLSENLATTRLLGRNGPIMRVTYEAFTAAPEATISQIVDFASDGSAVPPSFRERTVQIDSTHTVWGNPSRFLTGDVEIRDDASWKRDLSRAGRRWVPLITWPLARKYGYR